MNFSTVPARAILSWPPPILIRTVDATQPRMPWRDIRATIAQWMAEQAA